jgi:DNA polymerase III subunit epsilon
MKKILYFDCETTGLDSEKHDIIQLAGIIVAGKEIKEFNFNIAPTNPDTSVISQEALDVNGYSIEQIMGFTPARDIYFELLSLFGEYIDKYDKNDKFTPAGYNVRFDVDFLKQFFLKNEDVYYGSWINYRMIDPLPVLYFLDFAGKISLENYKLSTVCEHFGIEIKAHDALSDIRATRELLGKLYTTYFKG